MCKTQPSSRSASSRRGKGTTVCDGVLCAREMTEAGGPQFARFSCAAPDRAHPLGYLEGDDQIVAKRRSLFHFAGVGRRENQKTERADNRQRRLSYGQVATLLF